MEVRKGVPVGAEAVRGDFPEEEGLCWASKDDRIQIKGRAV